MQIEASGTQQSGDALCGKGLLQSLDEWASRNRQLAQTLNNLIPDPSKYADTGATCS